jgi:hypothetical protein
LQFFSARRPLEFLKRVRQEYETESCQNIDPIFAAIIDEGKATLYELKTKYSLEDAFLIWEVVAVKRFNEWWVNKQIEKKNKR